MVYLLLLELKQLNKSYLSTSKKATFNTNLGFQSVENMNLLSRETKVKQDLFLFQLLSLLLSIQDQGTYVVPRKELLISLSVCVTHLSFLLHFSPIFDNLLLYRFFYVQSLHKFSIFIFNYPIFFVANMNQGDFTMVMVISKLSKSPQMVIRSRKAMRIIRTLEQPCHRVNLF